MSRTRKILLIVFLAVFVLCTAYIAYHFISLARSRNKDEDLASRVTVETTTRPEPSVTGETEETETETEYVSPIDFKALHEINPEIHAWLTMDGTEINFPVAQHVDDGNRDFYLRTGYDLNYEYNGTLFTLFDNEKDMSDQITIIYGHNQSKFSELKNFRDEKYWKDHSYMTVYTEEGQFVYKVFAAVIYSDWYIPDLYGMDSEEGLKAFLEEISQISDLNSHIDKSIKVTEKDHILILSTCVPENSSQRYLVIGVLQENEDKK